MSILDKIMFWKKKPEEFGRLEEAPLGEEKFPKFGSEEMPGFEEKQGFREEEFEVKPSAPVQQPMATGFAQAPDLAKELEIVSAKIDAIKASVESISQRLANIERIAEAEQKKKAW